jgi:AraC-like DNA-binding protein
MQFASLLPHGEMHFDAVAEQLGMSGRTLARQLASEGYSFSRLLDGLRSALARRADAEGARGHHRPSYSYGAYV